MLQYCHSKDKQTSQLDTVSSFIGSVIYHNLLGYMITKSDNVYQYTKDLCPNKRKWILQKRYLSMFFSIWRMAFETRH